MYFVYKSHILVGIRNIISSDIDTRNLVPIAYPLRRVPLHKEHCYNIACQILRSRSDRKFYFVISSQTLMIFLERTRVSSTRSQHKPEAEIWFVIYLNIYLYRSICLEMKLKKDLF